MKRAFRQVLASLIALSLVAACFPSYVFADETETNESCDEVSVEVTDEELTAELDRVREQSSRMITVDDRAVADGDIANIDYEGFCDGVAFAGGKGEGYDLAIGSHSFIDTFEEQLIGKNIGEEVEVNVTFPTEYHAPELAGKPALFKVKVNSIKVKELPELDDDFAQDVSVLTKPTPSTAKARTTSVRRPSKPSSRPWRITATIWW